MSYPAETNDGQVTSWIPLTTSYSPSAECSSYFRLEEPSLVAFDPGAGLVDPGIDCQPSQVTTWWNQANLGVGDTAVSILPLTCPSGWATAATSVSGSASTLALCCPSQYSLINHNDDVEGIDGNCASEVTRGQVLTYASTGYDNTDDWATATTTVRASSYVGAIAVVGWNVQRPAAPTTTPTQGVDIPNSNQTAVNPSRSLHSATASASQTQSSSPGETSDDLSTGTKAGIGVGVGVGVIGVVALIVALWIFRKRKRTDTSATDRNENYPAGAPYNADAMNREKTSYPPQDQYYGHTTGFSELPHDRAPGELSAVRAPVELEGSDGK